MHVHNRLLVKIEEALKRLSVSQCRSLVTVMGQWCLAVVGAEQVRPVWPYSTWAQTELYLGFYDLPRKSHLGVYGPACMY
jgi:hypothetical protein